MACDRNIVLIIFWNMIFTLNIVSDIKFKMVESKILPFSHDRSKLVDGTEVIQVSILRNIIFSFVIDTRYK